MKQNHLKITNDKQIQIIEIDFKEHKELRELLKKLSSNDKIIIYSYLDIRTRTELNKLILKK